MVITLRLLLTCVFSVVSCAEPESPYTVLNSSGRMTRSIDYSIFDRHSLASLIKNHPNKEDLDVLCAVTYGKYTRFTFNNLAQNINQFKDKAEALKKGLIDERLLQEQTPIEIKKALIKDTLQALSLPLPEDDETTRGAIVVHLKKKFISAFFQKGSDALRIIVYDEDLSQLAFSMIKENIFSCLKPFEFKTERDGEPSSIKELALDTLQLIYNMFHKFLDIENKDIPMFKVIEADKTLEYMLFDLLDLPDETERSYVILCIIKLFAYHPSKSIQITELIGMRFEFLEDISVEFAFRYNDILAIFRKVFLKHQKGGESDKVADLFKLMIYNRYMPLLRLQSIGEFSSQWTFFLEEVYDMPGNEVVFESFFENMFFPTGYQNYERDLYLFSIYRELYVEGRIPKSIVRRYIGFILESAGQLRFRPLLVGEMLGSFFEEDSPVYKDFNMKADYSKRKFDILTTIDVYFEIVTGLKFLFIRLRKSKQMIPDTLLPMISFWDVPRNYLKAVKDIHSELNEQIERYMMVSADFDTLLANVKVSPRGLGKNSPRGVNSPRKTESPRDMNSPKKNGSIRSGVSPRNSESPRGVNSPRNIISPRTILSPRTVNSSIQKDNPASETSPRIEKQSEEPASASDIDSHKILTIGINAVKIPLLSNIEKAPNSPSGHALSMEKSGVQPETSKTQTTKFLGISPKQLDCTASSPLAREIKILSTLPVEGDEQQPSRINDSVPETPRPIKTGMRRLSMNESCSLSQEIVDCQSNPSASEFTVKNPLYGRSNSTENPRIRKSPTLEDLNLGRASSSLNIESESSSNNSPKAPRGPRVVIIRGTKSSHNESNSSNSS